MELKMFCFGADYSYWICAENQAQADSIYIDLAGKDVFDELIEHDEITEEPGNKEFTYYHDGRTAEIDTFDNLIKKYCHKPGIFACSEF